MKTNNNDKKYYNTSSIGSDEVGTGDYFGPIIVTATYVGKENIKFLEKLKVMDSKKLPDLKIKEIALELLNSIIYESIILRNEEYNDLDLNLNQIKAILHNRVLLKIKKKVKKYDFIIIDQFVNEEDYFQHLNGNKNIVEDVVFLIKAEEVHLSVACASIISRYFFIKEMDILSDNLEIRLPYGAFKQINKTAYKIIRTYDLNKLLMCAKINFKNTKSIIDNYYEYNH